LKQNEPITATDLAELERLLFETGGVGTKEDFEKVFGKQEKLGTFIRSLVGLDREAAKKAFGVFLHGKSLTVNQIKFIDFMINHLTQNGVMDAKLLYDSPYSDLSPAGLDGVFADAEANQIVGILKGIEENAAA
jgi:type I restriction enzyme R subunit